MNEKYEYIDWRTGSKITQVPLYDNETPATFRLEGILDPRYSDRIMITKSVDDYGKSDFDESLCDYITLTEEAYEEPTLEESECLQIIGSCPKDRFKNISNLF